MNKCLLYQMAPSFSAMSKLEYDERMAQIEREIEHVAHHYRMHVDR